MFKKRTNFLWQNFRIWRVIYSSKNYLDICYMRNRAINKLLANFDIFLDMSQFIIRAWYWLFNLLMPGSCGCNFIVYFNQCLKLIKKCCRSSCLESQIIELKLKKNQQKIFRSSSKVVGLRRADWHEFPTLVTIFKHFNVDVLIIPCEITLGVCEYRAGPHWYM